MKRALFVVAAACGHTAPAAPDAFTSCAVTPGDRIVVDEINTNAQLTFDGQDVVMGFVTKRIDAGPYVDVARLSDSGTRLATTAIPDLNDAPVIASDNMRSIVCYREKSSLQNACVAVSHATDTLSAPSNLPAVPDAIVYGARGFVVAAHSDTGGVLQHLDDNAAPVGSPVPFPELPLAIVATTIGYAVVSNPIHDGSYAVRIDRLDTQLQPLAPPVFVAPNSTYPAIASAGDDLLITSIGQPGTNYVVIEHADGTSVATTFQSPERAFPATSNGRLGVLLHDSALELAPVSATAEVESPVLISTDAGPSFEQRAVVGVPDGFLIVATAPNPTQAGSWDDATFHVVCP